MTSPESNRPGARSSGAGVKGLLAMFEKSSSSPAAPNNGSNPANPASRDQSPAPRPLGKVKSAFVTVTRNNGPILGLQKVPVPLSPIIPTAEDAKQASEALDTAKTIVENGQKKTDVTGTANGRHVLDESNLKKHNLENQRGYTTPPRAPATPTNTPLLSGPVIVSVEPEETVPEETVTEETAPEETVPEETIPEETVPEKSLDPISIEKDKKEPTKPTKVESKLKPSDPKVGPAPKSPTKSTFSSKTNKLAPTTKSGKNLSLPPSKSTTTSPLPSPAFAPMSPIRTTTTTLSSGSRAKSSAAVPGTTSASTRTRTAAPTSSTTASTSVALKPRPATTATEKTKAPVAKKAEAKPAREPSKPPTIRSSAFAPTTASAAKLTADQKAAAARSRPPSSASVRNRSPPGSTGVRLGHSGTSSRPGRKDQRSPQRSPQRPQTSTAIRNPNKVSVGYQAEIPRTAGGDFLSRMMRPTTASAGKVSDKKPGATNPPPKRSASVASTSRRRETSLPPSAGRLLKQKTGEKPKAEHAGTEITPQSEETPSETSEVKGQVQEVNPSKETANAEVATESAQGSEDGDQSPTTTVSSMALPHEGESKDGGEVLANE